MRYAIALLLAAVAVPAYAVPPFGVAFETYYIGRETDPNWAAAVRGARCNLCHAGASKRIRNEYGQKLDVYLDRTKFDNRTIITAFEAVGGMKASDGRTFVERMEDGLLPSP
jgi:hypothetical protein